MPLVTSTEMFRKAYEGGYAVGAFNVNNMEIIQGITEAAAETRSPLILQVSAGARKYAKHIYLMKLVEAAIADTDLPICLHLDHGENFDICKSCIDGGFTSVMIDGSKHTFEENIRITREVVEYAHAHGVVVEGELGRLAGIEDAVQVSEEDSSYTRPEEVEEFVDKTGVDSLAIAIGTSHGAFKYKPGPEAAAPLRHSGRGLQASAGLSHCAARRILRHAEHVATINANGGKLEAAIGIPEDMLRKAATMAVCKINIDTDLRLAMTAGVRKFLVENPAAFDPRQYLAPGRDNIREMVKHKILDVLGSDGKA